MNTSDLLSVDTHFAFGKNWRDYADTITEEEIAQAVIGLQRLSGRQRLDGLSFLDIGCGSGLHALAAVRMGAARVVGVDIDQESVAASRHTLARFAPEAGTRFDVVSVFDMTPSTHGGFDLVYSWGVLHHTGDMYRALELAGALVRPGGVLMVALYKKTPFCGMWRLIKRWYSRASPQAQRRARSVRVFMQRFFMERVGGGNLDNYIREYSGKRGMNYYHDLHDWMGGYPYESISPSEVRAFFCKRGFRIERDFVAKPARYLPGLLGSGCDEYVLSRT